MSRTPGRLPFLVGFAVPRPTLVLALAIEAALLIRIAAANLVEWWVQRGDDGRVCLFPDAEYYWKLAQTIRDGDLFQIVEWGDIPHFALRTPGYPAFLAGCRFVLGDRPMGARLVQAILGAVCVWLVFRLTRKILGTSDGERTSTTAAALTSIHPYLAIMSALLLSEALFVPLLLVFLWATAVLWERRDVRGLIGPALTAGGVAGLAVLTRPSCLLYFPIALGAWGVSAMLTSRSLRPAIVGLMVATTAFSIVMAPWWIRNARIYGAFVPTALWMGASLYDGLNPNATGASDMQFLSEPAVWPLSEQDQDERLKERATAFVQENPKRAAWLALVKQGRYWSPWPNADGFRSVWLAIGSTLVTVPILSLTAVGLWTLRRDARAWVLLAGPLLYFSMLHAVFASSMRYRTPAEAPAMGLAAVGLARVAGATARREAT